MKSVLAISDIHGGSRGGPISRRSPFEPTIVSGIMTEQWNAMVDKVGHVDICIINGDLIEGKNKKENGLGTYTTDLMEQADIAIELLDMIDADKFYFCKGSNYHVENNVNIEHMIARIVKGEWIGIHGFMQIEGVKMHVRHWTNFSTIPYNRFNAMQKDAYVNRYNGVDVDVYLRSHTHHYGYSGNQYNLSITTPCWKVLDDYMNEKSQDIPDNGYITFNIDGDSYNWNASVFNIPLEMYTNTFTIN